MEGLDSPDDQVSKAIAHAIEPHHKSGDPRTVARHPPRTRDGNDPSNDLVRLDDLAISGHCVASGDKPGHRPGLIKRDEAMADQARSIGQRDVKEDELTHLELRWGDWFHGEPIPFAQRGIHAPSCHAEAQRSVPEQQVADLQQVGQIKSLAAERSLPDVNPVFTV